MPTPLTALSWARLVNGKAKARVRMLFAVMPRHEVTAVRSCLPGHRTQAQRHTAGRIEPCNVLQQLHTCCVHVHPDLVHAVHDGFMQLPRVGSCETTCRQIGRQAATHSFVQLRDREIVLVHSDT